MTRPRILTEFEHRLVFAILKFYESSVFCCSRSPVYEDVCMVIIWRATYLLSYGWVESGLPVCKECISLSDMPDNFTGICLARRSSGFLKKLALFLLYETVPGIMQPSFIFPREHPLSIHKISGQFQCLVLSKSIGEIVHSLFLSTPPIGPWLVQGVENRLWFRNPWFFLSMCYAGHCFLTIWPNISDGELQ